MKAQRPSAGVRNAIHRRAGDQCESCGRLVDFAPHSIHHRIPGGMGGSRDPKVNGPANLLLLCGSGMTGCHGSVESHRSRARIEGMLVPRMENPASVPVFYRGRWAYVSDGIRWLTPEDDSVELGRRNLALSILNQRGETAEAIQLANRALAGESIQELMNGGA